MISERIFTLFSCCNNGCGSNSGCGCGSTRTVYVTSFTGITGPTGATGVTGPTGATEQTLYGKINNLLNKVI